MDKRVLESDGLPGAGYIEGMLQSMVDECLTAKVHGDVARFRRGLRSLAENANKTLVLMAPTDEQVDAMLIDALARAETETAENPDPRALLGMLRTMGVMLDVKLYGSGYSEE